MDRKELLEIKRRFEQIRGEPNTRKENRELDKILQALANLVDTMNKAEPRLPKTKVAGRVTS